MKKTVIQLSVFLALSVAVVGQQSVAYPSWMSASPRRSTFVPAEYVGAAADVVGLQFKTASSWVRTSKALVVGSTGSGVLAISDRRHTTPNLYGWDTGYARVHSVTRIGKPSDVPARFLATVWDVSNSQCRILELQLPATGALTQTVIGPASAANALWIASTMVDEQVFLYDAQSSNIRRLIDSDQNGTIDLLDPTYVVLVPLDVGANELAVQTHPIRGFWANKSGNIDLLSAGRSASVFVSPGMPGEFPFLALHNEPAPLGIQLANSLVVGQRSAFVYGTPGVEFTIYKKISEEEREEISKKWTVPTKGHVVVNLKVALQLNDIVMAVPTEENEISRSFATKVVSTRSVVIFPILVTDEANQGESFSIRGHGFGMTSRIRYSNDQSAGTMVTKFIDASTLSIKLPVIGSPSSVPPHNKYTYTSIWIEDSVTGLPLSDPVLISIRHD